MSNNVPKLRFKGFNDEWKEKKLADIANVIMGQSPSSSAYNENYDGMPLIQGNADIKKRKTVSRIYTSEITKTCEIEDIIMSVRAPVGSIARATRKCCIGRGVCAIKSNENQDYLYQVLLDNEDKWVKVSQGSTFESINRTDITGLKIKVPSIEEQEKIANFLIKIDKIIEKQEEKVRNLENYKKGMMQKIFSQEIRFKDENGEEYPEWKNIRIEKCFSERSERGFSDLELLSVSINNGVSSRSEIDAKDNSSSDKSNYKLVRREDIVYNSMRMWQGASGRATRTGIVSPAYTVLKPKENINTEYFAYLFKSKNMINEFRKYSQGLTSDTWNLKYPQIKEIKVIVPCIVEQTKIANCLYKIDLVVEKEREKLKELRLWKRGLLQQMFV